MSSARQEVQNAVSDQMQAWNTSCIQNNEPVAHNLGNIAEALDKMGHSDVASDMRELNSINNDSKHFNNIHFDNETGVRK
jgi:hypothetical protein